MIFPSLHVIQFFLRFEGDDAVEKHKLFHFNITENTSFEEWIAQLTAEFNQWYCIDTDWQLDYIYNYQTGYFKLHLIKYDSDAGTFTTNIPIQFSFPFEGHCEEMLKFLNQDVTEENIRKIGSLTENKEFRGVWNRSRIYFHSSFSTSKREYLGCAGDTWQKPSKLFKYNHGMPDFNVWFTTDCHNRILPKHSTFIMELIFIANFKNMQII
jgi:hypothetical protein